MAEQAVASCLAPNNVHARQIMPKRLSSFFGVLVLLCFGFNGVLVRGYVAGGGVKSKIHSGSYPRASLKKANGIAVSPKPTTTPTTKLSAAAGSALLVPLPSTRLVALATLIPSCLGFYRFEYGVSYAYGTSVSLVAALVFRSVSAAMASVPAGSSASTLLAVASCHSLALVFYGARLSLFLLYREVRLPRFRAFRDKIEERSTQRGSRLSRAPFIASCAFLYACLCAPLFLTAQVATASSAFAGFSNNAMLVVATKAFVGCTWLGFGLGAVGDLTKSIGKAKNGEDALITDGVLRYLRHPNYTGESVGWASSFLAGIAAAACSMDPNGGVSFDKQFLFPLWVWKRWIFPIAASLVGLGGILFVLAQAATGLEKRQREAYGGSDDIAVKRKYDDWVKNSWAGITLGGKEKQKTEE